VTIADIAQIWRQAGVSCIPVRANGQKRPALGEWKTFQARVPSLDEVSQWWGNGHPYGIALICGAVSGNLEMTEIEGRAVDDGSLSRIMSALGVLEATQIWDRLVAGYSQQSPSGGLHLLYRIADHLVPGNEKLARDSDGVVLAETRGEGGYVIGAPSPGSCHPSGKGWLLTSGAYGVLPVLSWEERNLLHLAIKVALDQTPLVEPDSAAWLGLSSPSPSGQRESLSPGDDFALRTDWAEILEPAGWLLESVRGGERMWTRPGKNPRDGASASTDYEGKPGLYVWSTSTGLPTEEPLSKLFVYAHYNFNGNLSAAAQQLARRGFGSRVTLPTLSSLPEADNETVTDEDPGYLPNDGGNARYLWDRVRGRYLWLTEQKQYYGWDGQVWQADKKSTLEHQFLLMAEEQAYQSQGNADSKMEKRWVNAGNASKIDAALRCLRTLPGVAKMANEMDPHRHLLNARNGVLDLETGQLQPHEAGLLMTQILGATFDPQAICPRFEQFMIDVLPDEVMRSYVQRALGYSLLGDADQRAIFMIYGPSGTGKSTLMEVMREVLGDYATTAPAGTFKATRDKGPSNDLHRLRGKRFVSTSETADNASFDEDLIKRLTGRDRVSSRELYQEYQEWTPQCCIWLATNHPPKFNSDDDAIWKRAKLVPFLTQFHDREIIDMARKVLCPEADGILNWLLAGLREYLAHGLDEPGQVEEAAMDQRVQSDSVARFIDDRICDGVLLLGADKQIKANVLHLMYIEWTRQAGERPVGNRRFANRLTSNFSFLIQARQEGHAYWQGIGHNSATGLLGTIF